MSTEPTHSPDEPLDAVDLALLADLARIAEEIDPVPDGLVERSLFAITLAGLEAEVMELEYVQAPRRPCAATRRPSRRARSRSRPSPSR